MLGWDGRHNYQLNSDTVRRDLYRLLCLILADRSIVREAQALERDPLMMLRDQFVEDELVHLIIGTAVANRIHLEHMQGLRRDAGELAFRPVDANCGLLQPDVLQDGTVPLSFREACNKIIHAQHITVERDGELEDVLTLPSVLVIRGERYGVAWQCWLNIIDYIRASLRNFE